MRLKWHDIFFGSVVALFIAMIVFLSGCAPKEYYGVAGPEDRCPVVTVENANWADVAIYMTSPYQRIATVTGHTEKDITVCRLEGRPAEFHIRAIGGAFKLTLRGAIDYVGSDTWIKIYVGPSPNLSFIIG
jgi:hypothetical protein